MLGIITILWNRQEAALFRIYNKLIASQRPEFAKAIWERQPTHQSRRDLLSIALQTVRMTKKQAAILDYVIEKTKTMADRRNELMHAEYVVHGRTDKLHAKVKSPRSTKPPKHQKLSTKDLQQIVDDLEHLLMATETAGMAFPTKRDRKLMAAFDEALKAIGPLPEIPRSGSDLPTLRQKHGEEY